MIWLNQQSAQIKKKEEIKSAKVTKGISRLSRSCCNIMEKMGTFILLWQVILRSFLAPRGALPDLEKGMDYTVL